MKKKAFILLFPVFLSINLFSQDIVFSKHKEFNKVSLNKIFSANKLVIGLEALRRSVISYDGNFIGMYFVDPLVKTYQYKLIKINENGCSEIELKGNTSKIEYIDNSIGFSKDSKQFYALTTNMEVYIWNTESGELLKKLDGRNKADRKSPYAFVPNGAFSLDRTTGIVNSEEFIIYSDNLYNFNGTVTEPFKNCATVTKLQTSPSGVAFSKNNQIMAIAGTFSKKANIYSLKTGQNTGTFSSIKKAIDAMFFTSNNDFLLISEKSIMSKCNLKTGSSSSMFSIDKRCFDLDINCYNILAYILTPSGTTQLWDLNNDIVLTDLPSPFKITYKLLFNYDGNRLYTISTQGEVICWEIIYE